MKSIDEVMKARRICSSFETHCEDCPYFEKQTVDKLKNDEPTINGLSCIGELSKDEYYYLKKYKDSIDNSPLTWDELKQMEKKPVWIEQTITKKQYTGWAIIQEVYENGMITTARAFYKNEYGKTWICYRKEKE
jgi:hypothetical protein